MDDSEGHSWRTDLGHLWTVIDCCIWAGCKWAVRAVTAWGLTNFALLATFLKYPKNWVKEKKNSYCWRDCSSEVEQTAVPYHRQRPSAPGRETLLLHSVGKWTG